MTASSQPPFSQSSPSTSAIASSERDLNVDSPLYFLHIPKTAGTTLYVNMDDRFEVDEICPVRFISELIQVPRENLQTYRFFRGHLGYSLQHFVNRPLQYVTVLRDPIDRCISHYEDVRRVPNNFLHHRVNDHQMTFADFARDEISNVTLNNLQARSLAFDWKVEQMIGNAPLIQRGIAGTPLDMPDDELLDIAMERLRACAVVGIVERFEEVVALLSYRFGWYPIRPPRRLNQSAKRTSRDDLDEETLDLLQQLNCVDLALYTEATRLFEAQFERMVADLEQRGLGQPPSANASKESLDLTSALIQHYGDRHSKRTTFDSMLDFSMRRPAAGANWHSREGLEANGIPFRWTGPGTTSTLHLPLKAEGDLRLHLRTVRAIATDVLDSLKLQVNNQFVALKPLTQWESNTILEAVLPASAMSTPPTLTQISLTTNRTESMQTLAPHTPDHRQVGIAVSQVYVFPNRGAAPENRDLNLFPNHDEHWVEVREFVRSHVRLMEAIAAPKEFLQPFPGQFCDYGYLTPSHLPDWVVVAKHLTRTLNEPVLRAMAKQLHPVFANPVFFVLTKRTDLPTVSDFADPPWSEAAEFLDSHLKPGESLIAPEEFIYQFSEPLDLNPNVASALDRATWVAVHKGRLDDMEISLLQRVVKDFRPVFANLVFVIFSSRPEFRTVPVWASHTRSFWKTYYRRRWQQVISPLTSGGRSPSSIEDKP